MTKLMQWLFFGVLFFSIWLSIITKKINYYFFDKYDTLVLYFPFIAIIIFGIYAASVVLWQVYTFNNCEKAALELKKEIEEAKADLKAKGLKLYSEIS